MDKGSMLRKVLQDWGDSMINQDKTLHTINTYLQNPNASNLSHLDEYLTKQVGGTIAKQLFIKLGNLQFWPQQSQSPQKIKLANYYEDFIKLPECQNKVDGPVEKQLLKCLIYAFRPQYYFQCPILDPKYFPNQFTIDQLKRESEKLKKIIEVEKRTTPKIIDYFSQMEKVQAFNKGYNNLLAIKKELIYIDIADFQRLNNKIEEAHKQVKNRNIVLFIGHTGSGKTTFIKALLGYQMGPRMYKNKVGYITIVESVTDPKVLEMDSNPECKSVTRYVVAVKPKASMTDKDVYLTDTPGFGATTGVESQIANNIAISTVFRNCRSVVPVIVISKQSWGLRGEGFRDLARNISVILRKYIQYKESIVIMMNRFTSQQMIQMSSKLESLISNVEHSDLADENYMQFLKHLKELADKNQLQSFDLCRKVSAKEYLNTKLLAKPPLRNPSKVFNYQENNGRYIKKYCEETHNRILYHLQKGNIDLLNYLLKQINKFYQATHHDFLRLKSDYLKKEIQKATRQKFNKIISEFNNRINNFSLCEEDFNRYFNDFNNLKQKDYCRIINNGTQDSDNIKYQANRISIDLMSQQNGMKIDNQFEVLMTLCLRRYKQVNNLQYVLVKETSQRFRDKIQKLVIQYIKAFAAEKFDSAICLYENAMRILGYDSILHSMDNEVQPYIQHLKTYLFDLINLLWREINLDTVYNLDLSDKQLKSINIEQLKRTDHRLIILIKFVQSTKLCSSYKFMAQQQRKQIQRIEKISEQFIPKLKHRSTSKFELITKAFGKTRNTPIQEIEGIALKNLFEEHQLMRKIPSLTQHIELQTHRIISYFKDYMESQRTYLINLQDRVVREPRSFINQIADIRSVFVGRISFSWLENEDLLTDLLTSVKKELDKTIRCFRNYASTVTADLQQSILQKFKKKNFEDIITKANDMHTMYYVYKEPQMFRSERNIMIQANKVVESIIDSELKRYASLINSFHSTIQKIDGFLLIQECMEFFQLVSFESPYAEAKQTAKKIQILTESYLTKYAQFLQLHIQSFKTTFLKAPNKSVVLNQREMDQNQEVMGILIQLSRASAREVWWNAKRCLRIIQNIIQSCPRIYKVYPFNLTLSKQQLKDGVEEVYNILQEYLTTVNGGESGIEKLQVTLKKVEQFIDEDYSIIGERVNDFKALNKRLILKIIELQQNSNKDVIRMLKEKQFSTLKCVLQKHKSKPQTYGNMLVEIQKYLLLYKQQKRQCMNWLYKQELDKKFAMISLKEMKEVNSFLDICVEIYSNVLAQYSKQFEQHARKIQNEICQRISQHIKKDTSLSKANQLITDLQQMQKHFSKNVRSKKFRSDITHKLWEIQDMLNKKYIRQHQKFKDYNQLYKFFKGSQNQKHQFNQLQKLRKSWQIKLQIQIDYAEDKLRNARTQKSFNQIRDILEYFVKFMPNPQSRQNKFCFISQQRIRLQQELQRQDRQILPFQLKCVSVENLFINYIGNTDNQRLHRIQTRIENWCQKRIQQHSKSSLQKINELFCNEVSVFITKIAKSRYLNTIRNIISNRFITFYNTKAQKISKQICVSVNPNGYDQIEGSLRELYSGVQQYSRISCSEFIERVMNISCSTYVTAVNSIVRFYERITKSIDIDEIFTNKRKANFILEFEIVSRLQKTIMIINDQLKSQKNGWLSVESWDIKTQINSLASEENIITKFVSKLQKEIEFIKNFNFQVLDNADEIRLWQIMNKFKNSVQLITKNRKIYEMLQPNTPDTHIKVEDFENSLKQQAKSISEDLLSRLHNITKDQEFVSKLKYTVLKLDAFDRVYGEEEHCVSTVVKQKILQIIETNFAQGKKWMIRYQDIYREKKRLQDQQQTKKWKVAEGIQNQYQTQINQIAQEMDAMIIVEVGDSRSKLQEEKKKLVESITEEKNAKLLVNQQQIESYYKFLYDDIDKGCFTHFQMVADYLIHFKMIAMNIAFTEQQCRKHINEYMTTIGKYGKEYVDIFTRKQGKKYVDVFTQVLHSKGNSFALKILKENVIFDPYSVRLFKRRIKDFNWENVLANTKLYLNGVSLNVCNEKIQKQNQTIFIKLNSYYHLYTSFISKYRTQQNDVLKTHLKESIRSRALEVKKDYQFNNNQRGHELIACIFALWTISKARNTDKGIEFLYYPHPSQVIAIFFILGFSQENRLSNRLAEILAGEGKSVVLAVLASYLALVGYEINVVCHSRLLSEIHERDFRQFFKQLEIEQWIQYCTFEDIGQKLYNSQGINVRLEVEQILLNNNKKMKALRKQERRKKIMLIDQADVLFSKKYFGQMYRYGFTIKSKSLEQLANYVWINKSTIINPNKILQSRQFQACKAEHPHMEDILIYQAIKIYQGIHKYQYDYKVKNQRIEGINGVKMSWAITFAYYYEEEKGRLKTRPQDEAGIILNCGKISYAELPTHFEHIMGVSATLRNLPQCQKAFLKEWYKIDQFYQIPSIYGQTKRKCEAQIVQDKLLFETISKAIFAKINKGQPVLVFFSDLKEANSFYFSKQFKLISHNAMTLSEENNHNEIKKCIDMATCYGRITISTRAFARGIDFVVEEQKVRDAGGVHVIQTFISENLSESVHIEGRTARLGEQGSLQIILSEKTVQSIILNVNLFKQEQSMDIYKFLKYCDIRLEKNYETLITIAKNGKESHIQTMKFLELVKANNQIEVRKQMKRFNKY